MVRVVAVNTSPRRGWNTSDLVRAAAKGAEFQGAQSEVIDLYTKEKFTGCISCFACKKEPNLGRCVCRDGLAEVLEKIRKADGLILGTANYLCSATAGFHALYERLVFQYLTYRKESMCCNPRRIPVLLIITGNMPETSYAPEQPNGQMLLRYQSTLNQYIGPTKTFVCGDTIQVKDYSLYHWTLFDAKAKMDRHTKIFPKEKERAFCMGAELAVLSRRD